MRERGLPPLVNLVFMGMGEPLDNLAAVRAAVDQLVDPAAFAFSRRNVRRGGEPAQGRSTPEGRRVLDKGMDDTYAGPQCILDSARRR